MSSFVLRSGSGSSRRLGRTFYTIYTCPARQTLHSSRDMSKLCLLLFLLPVSDARLRGFKAQDLPTAEAPSLEVPATVSCDQESSAVPDTPQGEFDELALLQREMTPAQSVHQKSHEEWLAHASEGQTKISADERVLHNDTVAGQLSKLSSDGCADDPMWQDADGDGCEIYRFAIASGKMTQEAVCNGGGDVPPARGLRGSAMRVVADATAKVFCPVTCGMCQPAAAAEQSAEGLDDVAFLQVGVSSSSGVSKKTVESWEEHMSDHESRITTDQRVLDNETVAFQLSKLQKGEGCADDPMWRDADGDGCEIYRFVIESGKSTRDVACNGGGETPPSRGLRGARVEVVADATARIFCPVTCGMC
ncbi:unnamed protein product [Prorocentrum cordatum]|uniref:Uncharacterized protein n=1 Tax=Prorocentrum cordatum TaxID=2364126 RepID=A0ABN9WMN4_9DINO|nr:unnamed protein product [Polarella glacialis]